MTAASHTSSDTDLRSETAEKARQVAGQVVDKAAEFADRAGVKIDEALNTAGAVAKAATDKGREATAQADEVASNLKVAIEKSLKDQPMTTLALAALAGIAIGALWKS
jgi:ElaB/YqjD/DUF883 family membrane-anchored ribosome-binding protein